MYNANDILNRVNQSIAAMPYDRQPMSLYEPIRYVLSLGGKRIRPVLMMLSHQLYRDDIDSIMMQALGLETYHNYTLLHDDLMDKADLRRGKPTVHKKWDANAAILSGDTMLVLAYRMMLQCDARHLNSVSSIFTETALEIGEGQQYDIDFEHRLDVTEDEYIEMIRLKTSVLLACAMKIGAITADATDADAQLLYKVGEQMGLAFQLQDDLLDVYGDSAVFGKAIGGDITSNKKTYMLINAVNRADKAQREELIRWIEATDFDSKEKIQAVTRIYDEIGIRSLCEERINHYFDEAHRYLDAVSADEERKAPLRQYMAEMLKREF